MKDTREIADADYAKGYVDWHIKTGGFARDMTMRDHFAAQAMTTMFYPAIMESIRIDEDLDCLAVAGFAYKMADAMLKERIN